MLVYHSTNRTITAITYKITVYHYFGFKLRRYFLSPRYVTLSYMSSYENTNTYSDPWLNTKVSGNVTKEFEDKFVIKASIVPLDDSQSYIAALERKLTKLKHGNKNKRQGLLQAAENTCDSYMRRLISSSSRDNLNVNQDTHLEEPVTANSINSWIKPEQALVVGELVELLKNDSLSTNASSLEQ